MQNKKNTADNNSKAFEFVYLKYHRVVFHYILLLVKNKEETENLLQDVFISLWEMNINLDEEIPLRALLYKIARNKALNYLRKKTNEQFYMKFIQETGSDSDFNTEKQINFNELQLIIKECISKLPERRRQIFCCSFEEGLSYKEIAGKLSISENTVDSQIRHALEFIRDYVRIKFHAPPFTSNKTELTNLNL